MIHRHAWDKERGSRGNRKGYSSSYGLVFKVYYCGFSSASVTPVFRLQDQWILMAVAMLGINDMNSPNNVILIDFEKKIMIMINR